MIEVLSRTNQIEADGPLRGAAIDLPAAGTSSPGYGIEIAGWAVATDGSIDRIDVLHGNSVVRSAPLSEARPDVAQALDLSAQDRVGFRAQINLVGLPLRATLQVAAKIGGAHFEIGTLTLRRDPLRVSVPPRIHPLIITTMGRTGSVWLSRLVGEHPAIVSYRPFELEPRMGSYWMHVIRALADPASIGQGITPLEMRDLWWLGNQRASAVPRVPDPEVADWLARAHPERTAHFCLECISDFYERVASVQGKPDVVYYAEKYSPSFVPAMLLELDVHAKEVFLVRDPRDQLASVVSWSSTGRAQFSTEANTAEEYVQWLSPRTKGLLRHWQARASRSLLIRYEDLILAPEAALTRLFEYVDVDRSPEVVAETLERAQRATPTFQRQHQTSASAEQSVGRWRDDISPDMWETLAEVFAPELAGWYGEAGGGPASQAPAALPAANGHQG